MAVCTFSSGVNETTSVVITSSTAMSRSIWVTHHQVSSRVGTSWSSAPGNSSNRSLATNPRRQPRAAAHPWRNAAGRRSTKRVETTGTQRSDHAREHVTRTERGQASIARARRRVRRRRGSATIVVGPLSSTTAPRSAAASRTLPMRSDAGSRPVSRVELAVVGSEHRGRPSHLGRIATEQRDRIGVDHDRALGPGTSVRTSATEPRSRPNPLPTVTARNRRDPATRSRTSHGSGQRRRRRLPAAWRPIGTPPGALQRT